MSRVPDLAVPKHRKWMIGAISAYLLLLLISHGLRLLQSDPWSPPPNLKSMRLSTPVARSAPSPNAVVIRYLDTAAHAGPETPVILLIHGSPMAGSRVFTELTDRLKATGRLLVPDLPGSGFSTRRIDDYGFTSHAAYLLYFLEQLDIQKAHLVAYSMGGGAAIHMAARDPDRVASLILISSIGVQELELLGDYHLNHALHGLQLGVIWGLQELTPHMGYLDRWPLNTSYARIFFDSDQRPIRNLLGRIQQPTLLIHGQDDAFVPLAAAREHHRLVPHSDLISLQGGHFVLFRQTAEMAERITQQILKVENGAARTIAQAEPSRRRSSQAPFNVMRLPRVAGLQLLCYVVLIALATLISEDLACIGAGMLAARGIIGFLPATLAAFAGIVIGDLMLYAAGRFIGKPSIGRIPLRWFIKAQDVAQATRWFEQKGPGIIFASRFLPGSRLPVYFAAGVLGGNLGSFLFYFCIAAALWTPLLVGLSMWAGEAMLTHYAQFHHYALWVVLITMAGLWVLVRCSVPLMNYRGRRLMLSRYKRLRHWEFWPLWLFYLPIVGFILWRGFRHRHWTLFTAANPAMPAGGIVGESKSEILSRLTRSNAVAPFDLVSRPWPLGRQLDHIRDFMEKNQVDLPLVCKPDIGERGQGVEIVHDIDALCRYLQSADHDTIVQKYIPGREFGVFYYRYPDSERGRIFAITDKRLPYVTGDGRRSLERLILQDPRAICMAPLHLKVHQRRLKDIPSVGKKIPLVSVGTHCRGAVFLDGSHYITDELTRSIDQISRHYKGFYFGRYDVRTSCPEEFKHGRAFTILELNGVTSEATHIYDPANTLLSAWRTLMRQWQIAFEIGEANQKRGVAPLTVAQFFKLVLTNGRRPPLDR